jgi:hypothetical protein
VTLLPVLSPSLNGNSKIETSDKKEFKSKKQTVNLNEGKTTISIEPMS